MRENLHQTLSKKFVALSQVPFTLRPRPGWDVDPAGDSVSGPGAAEIRECAPHGRPRPQIDLGGGSGERGASGCAQNRAARRGGSRDCRP